MSDIVLHEINQADLPEISRIYGESFEEPYPEPVVVSLLQTPGAWCRLAGLVSGETWAPAGFAIARTILNEAEVLSIGTRPEARRRGVAAALLTEVISEAGRRRARVVHLEVGEDNPGAVALYLAHGFETVGRRPDYYRRADRSRVAALLMSRSINPQE